MDKVIIILGETVVRGPDHPQHLLFRGRNNYFWHTTLHLFFRGRNIFGHQPLNIYFFEVVFILGETVVRGPDHSTFFFSRSYSTLHLFFRGRNNYFGHTTKTRCVSANTLFFSISILQKHIKTTKFSYGLFRGVNS